MYKRFIYAGIFALLWTIFPAKGLHAQSASESARQMAEGAQIFNDNCMRCHNVRSPRERSDADWSTIMLHMRARANLTKAETRAVTVFLKASNGQERGSAIATDDTTARPERAQLQGTQSSKLLLTPATVDSLQKYLQTTVPR